MSCVVESGTMPVRLEIVVRRRIADRPARVAAHAGNGEIRRHCRARSTAGAAWIAIEVVGVLRLAESRADGRDPRRQLVHVRLAENHRAGGLEPLDLKRVARRVERRQRDRARCCRHFDRFVVVLHEHRNPVKRTARAAAGAFGVERGGGFAGFRVDGGDGVQRRSLFVVRLDPREKAVDQLPRRHLVGLHRALQLLD
jgi:hypothetical protein